MTISTLRLFIQIYGENLTFSELKTLLSEEKSSPPHFSLNN